MRALVNYIKIQDQNIHVTYILYIYNIKYSIKTFAI